MVTFAILRIASWQDPDKGMKGMHTTEESGSSRGSSRRSMRPGFIELYNVVSTRDKWYDRERADAEGKETRLSYR